MKSKRSIKNIISALLCQTVVMVLGFVVPRLTLTNYGSETNGYMNLVSQIYSYINLVEAGLSTAVVQALYAPIASDDKRLVSRIIAAAKKYYQKIAYIYIACIIIVSIIVPIVVSSSIGKMEMVLYFLLFGISNVVNFWFTASMRPLLIAEGKNYVTSNITMIFHFASQIAKILLLNLKANIVLLQASYTFINILQIIVFYLYFRKCYNWIDRNAEPDMLSIKQRKAFFLQQISGLIFSCTDVILLSTFCSLKVSSVYAVYMLIFNSLSTMLSLFSTSTQFILGQTYNTDGEKYLPLHRCYDCCLVSVAFMVFTTASILTIPFIKLYTVGVDDINYIDWVIPIMLSVNGLLATCKSTALLAINFAFHAEQTMVRTFIEAGLNIGISLCMVSRFGIRGVLLGTCVALIYRLFDSMFYVNRKILYASVFESATLYGSNFILFFFLVFMARGIELHISSYVSFFLKAIPVFLICIALYGAMNYALNRKYLNPLIGKVIKKVRR